jgi:multidrug efflux pump subunit AcrA (membrane-fusion protein)
MSEIPASVTQYTNQSLSAIHHALRAPRRRVTIGLVAHRAVVATGNRNITRINRVDAEDTQTTVTVRQLAKEIVSIEDNVSLEQATGDSYHNVYTALIQTHLPELDDIYAVDYDSDRKEVEPDLNLVPLAMVAAISSPISQMLFHDAIANLSRQGKLDIQD